MTDKPATPPNWQEPCTICGELSPKELLGWWGECPKCMFFFDQLGMSLEDVKKARKAEIEREKKKG